MRFYFFTLFPQLILPYFEDSILKRAQDKNLLEIQTINFREFATNTYHKVDNPPISGGAGQVLMFESLARALWEARDSHIIFLSPCGKTFTQNDAMRLSKKSHISFVCGRYEGFDERLIESFGDEVFSIGDFILTGGELGALCLADSIARQIPQVLGNEDSLKGESFESHLLEAPNFAKNTTDFEKNIKNLPKLTIPSEYSKGNHNRIAGLKHSLAGCKTRYFRPDLFRAHLARTKK